ncbi:MAG: DUF4159 domain-containing protein [Rhodospirillaceae bacterium]|nr:DUF4159 domain-containing protein [Rhodospirillaceae bacterium]MBT3491084.1 DUF4159 domain-containing protein [Rhodospirillaceae bacterium]MBT3781822.1 DUF4159 domain-containing protein [Rhodospirillaceae bacterium]MBT3975315.1 DUF4159 domain-containing protein [Rhodospirillaceae bacterium]MBT4167672.1 DUF4159 domain-containing protein [Rhodospirillaceae bacterium]
MSLGPLALTAPWMLLGLAALPLIWWLLRITPPAPRRVRFPPIRILFDLRGEEETPAATPLWLALLRLLLAALVVLALAHPLLHPGADLSGEGPVLLVIDDGWAAAPSWPLRQQAALTLVERAKRRQRPVLVLTTAPPMGGGAIHASGLVQAAEAEPLLRALQPKPWATDRAAAALAAQELDFAEQPAVYWLSDGIDGPGQEELAGTLAALGPLHLLQQAAGQRAMALLPPVLSCDGLQATVLRAEDKGLGAVTVRALGERGRVLGQGRARFGIGQDRVLVDIALPGELRNRALRLELAGAGSAAASVMLDERWRRRPVGLVSGATMEERAQPLLSNLYYLERALRPYAELRRGEIDTLLQRPLAVLVLADIGQLPKAQQQRLGQWLKDGGMLVRFAGPHLAQGPDALIPTALRQGGRSLGGSLSWSKPAGLAAFPKHSPFHGLTVPGDVLVKRQVLAQPSQDLSQRTWASLADGTPMVTAVPRGQGWLVLFHVTANASWSNLPLSGLFVDMMRRLTAMSRGVAAAGEAVIRRQLPPLSSLDAFGRLGPPAPGAEAINARDLEQAKAGPRNPPGYYGREDDRRALNLSQNWQALHPITELSVPARMSGYLQDRELDLKPWLLLAAVLLALADLVAVLALRGLLRPGVRTAALLLAAILLLPDNIASAQQFTSAERFAMAAALDTRLAYVLTGDGQVDEMSRAGLAGLSNILRLRTSIEPEAPMAVNVEQDPLVLFPLLYWPVVPTQPALSDHAIARISQYMRTGGTIVFDSRDAGNGMPLMRRRLGAGARGGSSASERLRQLLSRLDLPPVAPVPQGHVLTRSFYLLQDFPGRYVGAPVWVERRSGGLNDGVSALIIGGNDWAAAWAMDERHRPLVLPTPGGARQREMAYRFGVNLVMYALTGNYKSDQVHIPTILERLGQ